MKTCSLCGVTKGIAEFWSTGGRLRSSCKSCERQRNLRYRKDHPEIVRQSTMRWRQRNPEKMSAQYTRKKLKGYGITEVQYRDMSRAQGGVCAVCGETNTSGMALAVDHSHRTGEVRGLLCNRCNAALGFLKNDPERCLRAALYLEDRGS
jgi:hypothetical protein